MNLRNTVRSLFWMTIGLFVLPVNADAFTIDWDNLPNGGWNDTLYNGAMTPTSQTFSNVDGSGIDITVKYTGDFSGGAPDIYGAPGSPGASADQTGDLRITNDTTYNSGFIDAVRVEIIFSQNVYIDNATIRSLDLVDDSGTLFMDRVFTCAFDDPTGGNLVAATTYTHTDNPSQAPNTILDGNTADNIYTTEAQLDPYGGAKHTWTDTGVRRLVFDYGVVDTDLDEFSTIQGDFSIAPVEFSAVPEPNSALLLLIGGGGYLLLRRPRRTV